MSHFCVKIFHWLLIALIIKSKLIIKVPGLSMASSTNILPCFLPFGHPCFLRHPQHTKFNELSWIVWKILNLSLLMPILHMANSSSSSGFCCKQPSFKKKKDLFEKQRDEKSEGLYSLLHSQTATMSGSGSGQTQEPATPSGSPMHVAGIPSTGTIIHLRTLSLPPFNMVTVLAPAHHPICPQLCLFCFFSVCSMKLGITLSYFYHISFTLLRKQYSTWSIHINQVLSEWVYHRKLHARI